MSSNKRIFYACQAVGIANMGESTFDTGDMVHGSRFAVCRVE
jgi:hypothetical protein